MDWVGGWENGQSLVQDLRWARGQSHSKDIRGGAFASAVARRGWSTDDALNISYMFLNGAGRGVQAGKVETPAMAAEAGRETRRGAESDEESDGCDGAQDSARVRVRNTQHNT